MERIHLTSDNERFVLQTAVRTLEAGGITVYPTDTVYGLGAIATDESAVATISTIKERDPTKPMLVLVADVHMLERYAIMTNLAYRLAHAFLPGPLSLVLTGRGSQLAPIEGSDHSIGFRVAHTPFLSDLVHTLNVPITSTSVNKSGEAPLTTIDSLNEALGQQTQRISLIIDAGTLPPRQVSTLVDARGERAIILREGAISRELLSTFL